MPEGPVLTLDRVVVTGSRMEETERGTLGSLSLVEWREHRASEPGLGLDELFRGVPGVQVQNSWNFSQDLRLSIRGFGTRSAFGIREVMVLQDGIPETSPDGQTQLDNLDLDSVSRVEVFRGTASAFYGNASGGVIHITTDDGAGEPGFRTRFLAGSYGMLRQTGQWQGRLNDMVYRLHAGWTRLRGYRGHSRFENRRFSARTTWNLPEASRLKVSFNLVDSPIAQDAGGLTLAEMRANPRQPRALNVTQDAGEQVREARLGLHWERELGEVQRISMIQYTVMRDFSNKLPILPAAGDGIVKLDRSGVGWGGRWESGGRLGGFDNRLMAGVDVAMQWDDRERFANLGGDWGALGFSQVESVRNLGVFLAEEWYATDAFKVQGALRYDHFQFGVRDAFLADGDDSARRPMAQVSPSLGIHYEGSERWSVHAGSSTGFQTPTTTELAHPSGGGGFNLDLQPQRAWTHEVGLRLQPNPRIRMDASLFWIQVRNELIPFTSASGRDFYRNAGQSARRGAEVSLVWEMAPQWTWNGSVTWMRARYRRYVTAAGDWSGHPETGIPTCQAYTSLDWHHADGWFASMEAQFVNGFPLDDATTRRNDSYVWTGLRLGWEKAVGRGWWTPFVGVNNVLDQDYSSQVRLNAFGGRYYEPSPGRHAYGGLSWRMNW